MSSLPFHLRYSARSYIRRPGLALALLFTIALGTASYVSILGFVRGLTKPASRLGSLDQLVSVFARDADREAVPLSKQQYLHAKSRHDVFQWLGAARVSTGTVAMAGQTALVSIAAVTSNLTAVLGLPLDDGVVISHRLWQGDFGATADVRGAASRRTGWKGSIAIARLMSGCLYQRKPYSGSTIAA